MIRLFVGFDQREAVAYHTFCQSVLDHASVPVYFIPLAKQVLSGFDGQRDGSNAFIYSRFLIPALCDFSGHAIFADGDMIVKDDIAKLWALRDHYMAVQVVKHDYKTKHPIKYLGAKNEDYPRKNWSSLMIWNCASFINRQLSPAAVEGMTNSQLHRFSWIPDDRIGALPPEWNHLVMESDPNPDAKLLHFTIGTPCFPDYSQCPQSNEWHRAHERVNEPTSRL